MVWRMSSSRWKINNQYKNVSSGVCKEISFIIIRNIVLFINHIDRIQYDLVYCAIINIIKYSENFWCITRPHTCWLGSWVSRMDSSSQIQTPPCSRTDRSPGTCTEEGGGGLKDTLMRFNTHVSSLSWLCSFWQIAVSGPNVKNYAERQNFVSWL